ncbi:MAG: hypothetical protein HY291_02195 [Planctomycetes bacterium]|nr:hypothetical protein [Planctomycetota bacterium]
MRQFLAVSLFACLLGCGTAPAPASRPAQPRETEWALVRHELTLAALQAPTSTWPGEITVKAVFRTNPKDKPLHVFYMIYREGPEKIHQLTLADIQGSFLHEWRAEAKSGRPAGILPDILWHVEKARLLAAENGVDFDPQRDVEFSFRLTAHQADGTYGLQGVAGVDGEIKWGAIEQPSR